LPGAGLGMRNEYKWTWGGFWGCWKCSKAMSLLKKTQNPLNYINETSKYYGIKLYLKKSFKKKKNPGLVNMQENNHLLIHSKSEI
jgi:hypothetical protein